MGINMSNDQQKSVPDSTNSSRTCGSSSSESSGNVSALVLFGIAFSASGFLLNLCLLIHLCRTKVTSRKAQIVFRLQSVLDSVMCGSSCIFQLQVQFAWYPVTGLWLPIDQIICHVMHTSMLSYVAFCWSVNNMCLMAADRLVAVVWPLQYRQVQLRWYAGSALICFIVACGTALPWSRVDMLIDGQCLTCLYRSILLQHGHYLHVISRLWFVLVYAVPFSCIVGCYAYVAVRLSAKRHESSTFSKSHRRCTQLSVCIGCTFVLTQAFPAVCVLLLLEWHEDFNIRMMAQYAMLNLATANCIANPFIFFAEYFVDRCRRRGGDAYANDGQQTQSGNDS